MTVAPVNWMNGIAERIATAITDQIGVCSFGLTLASGFEIGGWLSRAMPNASRTVQGMIAMQHTKMAADTVSRETVDHAVDRFASMIVGGPAIVPMNLPAGFGIAISIAHRKIPPMMNAPMIEPRTALGASFRGFFVS